MRITSAQATWIISGKTSQLQEHAVLEPGSGPNGSDALRLTVVVEGLLEAAEERLWPVEAGKAYQLVVQTRSGLNRCHGQLHLVWLDEHQQNLSEEGSAYSFNLHDYAPLMINASAPDNACYARSVFRVLPDAWPDFRGVEGSIWVTAAALTPSVAVALNPTVPCALYDAGKTVRYNLRISAAPAGLARVRCEGSLFSYEQVCIHTLADDIALQDGKGELAISLPALEAGYYELHLVIRADGIEVPVVKTFGCLGALDFSPAQDTPVALDAGISQPFLHGLAQGDLHADPSRFREQAQACYKLGLRTLRDRFSWGRVQPEPDTFDWGQYRRAANEQHAAGLEVYHILSSVPVWTQKERTETGFRNNYPPADIAPVYTFCARAAREMGHTVRYWEFWNEPDIFFYAGHPWDLAAMTKAGALGIKDVDPTIGVLGGSRCAWPEFWRKWLANGVGPYIDIFNQHSYGKPEDEFRLIQENRDLMAAVGLERPIWMTEMGKRSNPSADGTYTLAERIQVIYLLRAIACGLAAGIDRFFYFFLQEFLEAGVAIWGIQRQDLSPKPAVLALGTLIRQIGRAKVKGYTAEDETYCVVFERLPGEYTGMVWSTKNTLVQDGWGAPLPEYAPGEDWTRTDGEITVPVSHGASLVDALGRKVKDCTADSESIKLSICPIFVRGIDPSRMTLNPPPPTPHYVPSPEGLPPKRHIFLQAQARPNAPRLAQQDAQAQKNALLIKPGQTEQVAYIVHNYGDTRAKVAVELDIPHGWRLVQVHTDAGSAGDARVLPLDVAARSTQRIVADYVPEDVVDGEEQCLAAWLYLDGAPHDQVAVFYNTRLPERRFPG